MAQPAPADFETLRPSAIQVTEIPKFDLDSYISNYEGHTRLDRLITIGTSSKHLARDALNQAFDQAKQGKNVKLYFDIAEYINAHVAPGGDAVTNGDSKYGGVELDTDGAEFKQRQVLAETDRLEQELKGYKNNLIKESIRMGNEDLGLHYYQIGDFPSAYRAYSRMREYCTTPKHVAEMNIKLALVAISQQNWLSLTSSIFRIQHTTLAPTDSAKINPAIGPLLGLGALHTNDYRGAARHFLRTDPAYMTLDPIAGVNFTRQILTPNDVAIYGGLTALATLSRAELASPLCLDSPSFRQFLELEPHLRRALSAFVAAKYPSALAILDAFRPDYLLDLHLQRHVSPLWSLIRRKCVVAFCEPFSRVHVSAMCKAFNVSSEDIMTAELVDMIENGLLDARIDLVDRVLVSRKKDEGAAGAESRLDVLQRAARLAEDRQREMRLKLFRMNCLEAGWEIRALGPPPPGGLVEEGGAERDVGLDVLGSGAGFA